MGGAVKFVVAEGHLPLPFVAANHRNRYVALGRVGDNNIIGNDIAANVFQSSIGRAGQVYRYGVAERGGGYVFFATGRERLTGAVDGQQSGSLVVTI